MKGKEYYKPILLIVFYDTTEVIRTSGNDPFVSDEYGS